MISQFRAVWHNEAGELAIDRSCDRALAFGPRSAGKVARWSMERAAAILRCHGRGAIKIAQGSCAAITPHERSLALVVQGLSDGDYERAKAHAQWLVKPQAYSAFLRALQPVSEGPASKALLADRMPASLAPS